MEASVVDPMDWIGRSETDQDVALRAPALRRAATLDRTELIARRT
jgi:hypothetical protein